MSAANKGGSMLNAFHETVIDDLPSIREAVNSGKKTFRDIIQLMNKSEQFKAWLKKQGGTEDLRKAYCQEIAHIDWADKLPPKSLRSIINKQDSMVPGGGVEPPRAEARRILSSVRTAFQLLSAVCMD
jgi:hypothetical protein